MPKKVTRYYGVDVSNYQSTSLYYDRQAGAKFVFVKATEGTGYFNPRAYWQVKSAHANKMFVNAYHFATFGANSSLAKAEARHFIHYAKYLNIAKNRFLALDWETGDGNYVQAGSWSSTNAILAFMHEVKKAGYRPMLYSSESLLRNNLNVNRVVRRYGTCIWVAKYQTSGRLDYPNFHTFPSMNGVAIWQFSDNWHGLNVDGNISLVNLFGGGKKKAVKSKPAVKKQPTVVCAPVINNDPKWEISLRDSRGHGTGYFINTNTKWKVCGVKRINGQTYYKLGTDRQFVPAKYLKVVK